MPSTTKIEIKTEAGREERENGHRWQGVVTVSQGASRTQHTVTVESSYRDEIAGPKTAIDQLVKRSFEFLLEREPKESILRLFDLRVIGRYFPEYEREIRRAFGVDS